MANNLKKSTLHPILGQPDELPKLQLPTKLDILRYILKLKCDAEVKQDTHNKRFANKTDFISIATDEVIKIWDQALNENGISPIIQYKSIYNKLSRLFDKCHVMRKRKEKEIFEFKLCLNELFDICSCQCPPADCESFNCKQQDCPGFHLNCHCKVKVPKREIQFLIDQRGERSRKIGSVDQKVTTKWKKRKEREEKSEKFMLKQKESSGLPLLKCEKESSSIQGEHFENEDNDSKDNDSKNNDSKDNDYEPKAKKSKGKYNTVKLEKTAEACDRYLISDRAGAAVANAVLFDYGVIEEDSDLVIGPSKLGDERHKYRMNTLQEANENLEDITSLYFDGKKIVTKNMIQKSNGKWHPVMKCEDHYAIVIEPGSEYLTHVTPVTGHGSAIALAIIRYLIENNLLQRYRLYIICIRSDGTNANVGAYKGAIHILEKFLNHPVHYFICQLHGNELPFRKLFYHYDGKPVGPEHWSGPIGKSVKESVSSLPVIKFKPIKFNQFPELPENIIKDLSWDQKYLYRICLGVINGEVSEGLANIEPGPACVSRWNTLWSRILRIYIATKKPSVALTRLSNIIVKFSAPMWSVIKCHPYATEGSKNTFQTIQYSKNLNKKEQTLAQPVIQRNAFFAHPDQLLLAMCSDENISIRKKAVDTLLSFREKNCKMNEYQVQDKEVESTTDMDSDDSESEEDEEPELEISNEIMNRNIRKVIIPKLNFNAKSYDEIVDLKLLTSEPPYLMNFTEQELKKIYQSPISPPKWKNNTQAVERAIKIVTESCTAVCGHKERDGFIKQRLKSRKKMPKFNTKKEFKI